MNKILKKIFMAGGLFVVLSVALALPQEDVITKKEIRSPAINDDFPPAREEQTIDLGNFFSVEKLYNNFLQLPTILYKFFGDVISRRPFAKLREEMRNLNISYPK